MILADLAGRQQLPLQPREIPFSIMDHTNEHVDLNQFQNLAQVLRYRATKSGNARNAAFTVVDGRGKESASMTWEKLNARAEKVSHMIREKSGLHPGERVALIYRKSEHLEFVVALLGCFLAGMVAVPINAAEELAELSFILSLTNAYLVLTTDFNLKAFTRDMQAKSIEFPSNIDWWKTTDFGSWYPGKKGGYPTIQVPDLAYIEYAKATNGELKGVAVNHKTIMSGCTSFQGAVTETKSSVTPGEHGDELRLTPVYNARGGADTVVTYLEQRQQIGLVISVLWSIFAGCHTVFASSSIVDTPAVWIYVLSKFKASMALADYSSLNFIAKYYQTHTKEVVNQSKKVMPDLSSLRFLMVDSLVVRPDLNDFIAESLLKPLKNKTPAQTICAIASLPEHGGMIIGFRDFLGPAQLEQEETVDQASREPLVTSVLATGSARDIFECTLNADVLKLNKVTVMATGEQARKDADSSPEVVCVGSFGFAIPEATIAIVDPETGVLCSPDTIGEIWVDAPSISGGFWAMPKHTEAVFHAKPIIVPPETLRPEIYDQEFLRTGLVGTTIGGRVIIFGPYEERVRQQRLGETFGLEEVYFSTNILQTLKKHTRVDQCTIFELAVNDQHMPIVACEIANVAKPELGKVANAIIDTVLNFHGLRIYGVIVMAPNTMARWVKHGRRHVHPLMVKRAFMNGEMPIRYLKMDVDRTVFNLAANEDVVNGLWRSFAAYDKAIRTGQIMPRPQQQQHTGMETVREVIDERTDFDLNKFSNIVDVLLWRTKLTSEEVAYIAVTQATNGTVINTKPYSWRKINSKIAAGANYLMKKGWKRGRKALVLVPFGVEWIQAIYACMVLGVIPVLFEPPDPEQNLQRLKEEVAAMVSTVRDLDVTYILTNSASEDIMKHKNTSMMMKQVMMQYKDKRYRLPDYTNIGKASKTSKVLGKESGFYVKPEWFSTGETFPALISVHTAMDGRHTYTTYGHETILAQCRAQKTTCQLKAQRSIVGSGLGAYDGLGMLHFAFCGVYVGSPTIMLSVSDFYANPSSYFELLTRYKAKDVCSSHPLIQYYMNYSKKLTPMEQGRFALPTVQNLMLVTEGRPRPGLYQHMVQTFASRRLEKEAINTVYSHLGNPMITTRSYMLIEPISLLVDFAWLRQGIIRPLPIEDEAYGIILHDSGIVPSNTMVAIVNPETGAVCPSNMVGEIWVSSDCNIKGIYGQTEAERQAKFEATLAGADPRIKYMRTGDLGFLWNVQRRVDRGQPVIEEGQCLFVLGAKSETIERNGLIHFPFDVELTVERCHPGIVPGGCIIFQTGQEIVVLAAVKANNHALSSVPLIVNSILESHSFLVDTVAIIHSNQLPRTRFGEKQRRKAMASFLEKQLPVLYVSRITNQHEPLSLPQWTQSQYDIDTQSVISMSQQQQQPQPPLSVSGRSMSGGDNNTEIGRSDSIPSQLERRDTGSSKQSGTRISSMPTSPAVAGPPPQSLY
ncbi:hypothetical protein BDB00DRAFT_756293 [Zychaea mexicana]|uniref:uncharacterized protein n=1 Tax=Zychaea mexicana TaxID=64656 RepID=UPI0022FE827E|nr:uncharacterized protein BDB00DRAFT_756293 [Zychaea mexicana]KAI9497565.1 hypothetical protein BDB00DRAFT_756293 [Zychaea mexicana]